MSAQLLWRDTLDDDVQYLQTFIQLSSYLLIPFLEIFGTSFSNILVNFHVEVNNNNQWQCSHEYQTCPIGDGRIGDVSSQISHTEIVFTLFGCHNAELEKFGNIDQN